MQYICKICGEKFESNNDTINGQKCAISKKFKKHLKEKHDLTLEQYILKIYFNNEIPKCHCGCGKLLKFTPKKCIMGSFKFLREVHKLWSRRKK